MQQFKLFLLTSMAIVLFPSVLYSDSNIIILNTKKPSGVVNMLIKGNGEECKVSMYNTGALIDTGCLQLRNSKKIKILCTKNKKMCKTVNEIRYALSSSSKDPNLPNRVKNSGTSPSFDCTKASNQIEHDICSSDTVSKLDLELGDMYLKIKEMMSPDDFRNLIRIQKEWVSDRDYTCGSGKSFKEREKCLIEIYNKRLDAFNLISVMDSKMDYEYSYPYALKDGTSEDRFKLSAYLYYQENDIKRATKLLRKIIADEQEDFVSAFFALGEIHNDYVKKFPQVPKELLEKNDGSIGLSLIELNATHDKIINALIEEASLLRIPAQIMLKIRYQYAIDEHPAYDRKILSFYEECAEEGMPRCEMVLGDIYLNGWGVKKNIDKGIELLEKSELGDAYLFLAEYYYSVKKDIEITKQYFKKASELGAHEASYALGIFAQEAKEYKKAIDYFNSSLDVDDEYYPAMLELSRMHIEGWGTEQNYGKAIDLLQTVIDNSDDMELKQVGIQNLSVAEYRLGLKYLNEKALYNESKAFALIEKSAIKNNMDAQYTLFRMYYNGIGVEKDAEQIIKWCTKSAEQGRDEAQAFLATMYLDGAELLIEDNHEKALYWAKKSAENNNSNGQYLYGSLMLRKNRGEAIDWLEKAAVQGHKEAKEALRELAVKLNNIVIPPKSHSFKKALKVYKDKSKEEAFPLMELLAKKGDPDAQAYLGKMYSYGSGVKKDKIKSEFWYRKAAAQYNGMGLYGVGSLVSSRNQKGDSLFPADKDRNEAIEWFEQSAARGYANAASQLAFLYSKSAGKNYNLEKSLYWAERAAWLGDSYMKYFIGIRFRDGIWFSKDTEKSEQLLNKSFDEFLIAANNGDPYSQNMVSDMYYRGLGTVKDTTKAIKYAKMILEGPQNSYYYEATALLQEIENETSYNDGRIKNVDGAFGIIIGDKVSNITTKPIPIGDKESFSLSMDIEPPEQALSLGFDRAVISFTLNTKQVVSMTVSEESKHKSKEIFDNVKRLLEKKYGVFMYKHSPKIPLWFEKKINDITIRILFSPSRGASLSYISERYEQMQLDDLKKFKWADRYGL